MSRAVEGSGISPVHPKTDRHGDWPGAVYDVSGRRGQQCRHHRLWLGLRLTYQINTHLSVDAGYNFDDVTSEIAGYSYTRNRVYLGLTANY